MIKLKDILNEKLDPMKDFAKDGENKKYDLNLGAFVGAYQDFIKFIKKHKEVPDGNKKEWALQIREKVGQSKFNGYIGLFTQPVEVLERFKKFEKLKNKDFHFTEGKKYESTSVNENREIDKVYGDFEVLLRDFEKEFISLSAQAGRANDNKADERILLKTLKKHIAPLYSMVRSWNRTSKRD